MSGENVVMTPLSISFSSSSLFSPTPHTTHSSSSQRAQREKMSSTMQTLSKVGVAGGDMREEVCRWAIS